MTFEISDNLRDRERAKFEAVQIGSRTAMAVVLCGISGGQAYPLICTSGTNGGFLVNSEAA